MRRHHRSISTPAIDTAGLTVAERVLHVVRLCVRWRVEWHSGVERGDCALLVEPRLAKRRIAWTRRVEATVRLPHVV